MQDPYSQFNVLFKERRFNEALRAFEEIERTCPPSACVLVKRGIAILSGEDDGTRQLTAVEQAYRDAITLDAEYIDAYLELAYFYLNVQGDAEKARPLFAKALQLCKTKAVEAVSGLAHCVEELESPNKALRFLAEHASIVLDQEAIAETAEEIQKLMPNDSD